MGFLPVPAWPVLAVASGRAVPRPGALCLLALVPATAIALAVTDRHGGRRRVVLVVLAVIELVSTVLAAALAGFGLAWRSG